MTLASLGAIGITILVAAIILSVSPKIMTSVQDSYDDYSIRVNSSETFNATNNTIRDLANVNPPDEVMPDSVTIWNATTGSEITSTGRWSIGSTKRSIIVNVIDTTGLGYSAAGNNWLVLYNVKEMGTAYNVTEYGKKGIDEMSSWIPTICLIIAAAVMIGIVMGSLAGKGQ